MYSNEKKKQMWNVSSLKIMILGNKVIQNLLQEKRMFLQTNDSKIDSLR